MRLTVLVAIILRLFAIYWLIIALVILTTYPLSPLPSGLTNVLLALAAPLLYFVISAVIWIVAGTLAKKVAGGVDSELQFASVTPENLFTCGILTLGLFFALSNLGPALTWIHYLILTRSGDQLGSGGKPEFYPAMEKIVPCVGGVVIASLSAQLGAKLARAKM